MNKQEKINILKKMMKFNFQENFNNTTGLSYGLCNLFRRASNYSHTNLLDAIPEIYEYRDINYYQVEGYWWPKYGRFRSWWYRHVAICKTIRQLKKS